ncbi:hypothetical protein [Aquibium microcysteis]|uniref:hypothetical protein n=1 Tax=Aquibium microcysteis TaxID=675281 RepID=UPI00165D0531|nr:hypothetical protein [Aquibium microcysteis]
MRLVWLPVLASSILALTLVQGRASGGLQCTAEDDFAVVTIESGVTRGMGGPVFNFRATSVIRDEKVAGDLRDMAFDGEHLAQYWLDGEELRLLLYRERAEGTHGYVQIEVRTTAGEEGLYGGTYDLTVFDMTGDATGEGRTFKGAGPVECFVE